MQAVDAMISNGDVPTAVRFARKFNIPSPHLLAAMERQGDHTRSEIRRYSESLVTGISPAHQKYYALPILFESIHFVDDLPKLQGCMKTISKVHHSRLASSTVTFVFASRERWLGLTLSGDPRHLPSGLPSVVISQFC